MSTKLVGKNLVVEWDFPELYPCPFCGSEPIRSDCIGCGYVQIVCPECNANISIVLKDRQNYQAEEQELIKRWNRRIMVPHGTRERSTM